MKGVSRNIGFAVLFLACSPVMSATNLCRNPGFEQLSDNKKSDWQLGPGASIASAGFSGKNALRLTSDKKGFDPVANQNKIAVEPGKRYRLAYHVRGDAGSAEVTGFQFFRVYTSYDRLIKQNGDDFGEINQQDGMEWQDAFDAWQQRTLEFTAPNKPTAGLTITCQLQGPGNAYFDDFTLEMIPEVKKQESLLQIRLEKPVYRNAIFSSTPADVITGEVTVKSPAIRILEMSFGVAGEKALWSQSFPVPGKTVRFSFPIKNLAVGNYQLNAVGLSETGKPVYSLTEVVRKLSPKPTEVTVDQKNRLLVNGKPFFPIGLWNGPANSRQAYEISRAGFNVFRANLDDSKFQLASQFGLKIVGCMPDDYVFNTSEAKKKDLDQKEKILIDRYKDNPALLIWFLSDESLWCGRSLVPIKEAYRLHHELDPYRPIMMNEAPRSKIPALAEYAAACDLYGVDIYPIPSGNSHSEMEDKSPSSVGKYTDKCLAVVEGQKPVFMTLQGFAWGHLGDSKGEGIYPTAVEIRFMTYDAIVHGATGIMYWGTYYIAKPSFWQVLFDNASELRNMSPVLVSDTVSPSDVHADKSAIRLLHKVCEGRDYIIAVNENNAAMDITFTTSLKDKNLKVLFENRTVSLAEGQLKDSFTPYAVHIYTNSDKLPPPLVPAPAPVKVETLSGPSLEENASMRERAEGYLGKANWIWSPGKGQSTDNIVFFRRDFKADEKVKKAILTITADEDYDVYLNGKKVGSDVNSMMGGWSTAERYEVTSLILAGKNVLAVKTTDTNKTNCGLLCDLEIETASGKKLSIISNETWRTSPAEKAGWFEVKFNDSNWSIAKNIGSYGISPWESKVLVTSVKPVK